MEKNDFQNATGKIEFNMTNDYMFRVVLQENKKALKGLLCALLRLKPEQILSIVIENPIKPGERVDAKEFYLDIHVTMNDNTSINLEMQVVNRFNWTERSLSYLCRNFADLTKGTDYINVRPAIHIGFLDYTLFKDTPEFYATYKMMNVRNYKLFSDKFIIGVVDLNRTDIATEEDREYQLDDWVRLFKAKTWEELKMIAEKAPELLEASQTMYEYNADRDMRDRCIARMEYISDIKRLAKLSVENEKLSDINERISVENEKLSDINEKLSDINERISAENEKLSDINERISAENEKLSDINERISVENEKISAENERISAENEQLKKLLAENGISID